MDRNLSDGNLALDLSRNGAHLQGTARFDGIPANLDANVAFRAKNGPRAVYRIGLSLNDEARRRLDLDLAPERVSGPVGVDLTYSVLDAARAEAVANLDLRGAGVTIAEAGWKKPPEAPATAKIVIDLDHERIVKMPQIDLKAAGVAGRFAIVLGAGRKQIER